MFYSDDPVGDFDRWDTAQERALAKCPTCDRCGDHIIDESAVRILGEWFCKECEQDAWEIVRDDYLESTES